MARQSRLSAEQWDDILKRSLEGIPTRRLAAEYDIAESAIRKRLGAQRAQIKTVANQLVSAERAFNALPIGAQIRARTLADHLKSISNHLASAAEYGASTSHRLAALANAQLEKIDDADPMNSTDVLQGVAALTKIANDASEIPMNLLKANKDAIEEMSKGAELTTPAGLTHFYGGS